MQLMLEKDHTIEVPPQQKMERHETLAKEHSEEYQAALRRAVTLAVPHAYSPSEYGTFDEQEENSQLSLGDSSPGSSTKNNAQESWDELIERLFEKDKHGHRVLKEPH